MFGFLKKLLGLPDGITAQDAQAMVKAGNAVILDVRTPAERKAEIGKDAVQEIVGAGASTVGEITSIITTAVM